MLSQAESIERNVSGILQESIFLLNGDEKSYMDGLSIQYSMISVISSSRRLALFSVLAALCLAIQLIPRPPNIEATSLFAFVIGVVQGSIAGAIFGGMVMFINGFLSPYGVAGLNLPFQMAGMAVAGLAGGIYRRHLPPNLAKTNIFVEVGILGASIALLYDIVTNIGVALINMLAGVPPLLAFVSAFSYGALFSIIHVSSNFLMFGALFLPFMDILNKLVGGVDIWAREEISYSQH